MAKAVSRQRELTLRRAIGAPWASLLRQFLTESVLLSTIGGLLAWVLIAFSAPLLPRLVPMQLPVGEIGVNGPVLWFAAAITLLTGVIFGAAPVIPMLRLNIVTSLSFAVEAEGSR